MDKANYLGREGYDDIVAHALKRGRSGAGERIEVEVTVGAGRAFILSPSDIERIRDVVRRGQTVGSTVTSANELDIILQARLADPDWVEISPGGEIVTPVSLDHEGLMEAFYALPLDASECT